MSVVFTIGNFKSPKIGKERYLIESVMCKNTLKVTYSFDDRAIYSCKLDIHGRGLDECRGIEIIDEVSKAWIVNGFTKRTGYNELIDKYILSDITEYCDIPKYSKAYYTILGCLYGKKTGIFRF